MILHWEMVSVDKNSFFGHKCHLLKKLRKYQSFKEVHKDKNQPYDIY